MSQVNTNYFVCTLGEAAQEGISRPFSSVNQIVEKQAEDHPDLPAIGFYHVPSTDSEVGFEPRVLNYRQVYEGVLVTAGLLQEKLPAKQGEVVGLLAGSSPEFLFTWLGCIRLGHPVLLVAPQCSASAIAHLCHSCEVSVLLVDEQHEDLAAKAGEVEVDARKTKLEHKVLPFTTEHDVLGVISRLREQQVAVPSIESGDIAYLHHTSGTSSGIPKPIPQSHHGAVGVLPSFDGQASATFTTTPLYHGGPADIFRAWASHAMIWLFPSQTIAVTPRNIIKCLEAAKGAASQGQSPSIKYFTTVPYILQMMAEDTQSLEWLSRMDLVSVGGAALPKDIGDKLVEQKVNLVSRFGAAECGFLLSSHRDYKNDRDWQYLRRGSNITQIKFEANEPDLYELVIKPDWPHMAKKNRDDGSYATSDLFAKHPSIPNAWKYDSRADSQLTLITGKKFDPAPLEDAIVASSTLISDVLVFGNGRPYPGALIFKSREAMDVVDGTVMHEIASIVEKLNRDSQSHARIPRNMLVLMPQSEAALDRSSKGTVLRGKAEERYASDIDTAYNSISDATKSDVSDDQVQGTISELIKAIVGSDQTNGLSPDADLFSNGVDSVACVQIRHGLNRMLPRDAKTLPLTVVEDSRTVSGLADLVIRLRHGDETRAQTDGRTEIPRLVEQFSRLETRRQTNGITNKVEKRDAATKLTVLLTGPTGSLGAHVLTQLLKRPDIAKIYLLIRGATPEAARERVSKALTSRSLPIPDNFDDRVVILQCKLSEPKLGLPDQDYTTLQHSTDIVLHLAWSVNFLLSLGSFSPHFAGIQNLLDLCQSSQKAMPPKLVFCSSVASVSALHSGDTSSHSSVPEAIITDTAVSGPTGYALSKLTAELILARAATLNPLLQGRITIIRVGQLSADTKYGVWNKSEAYPQILASAKSTESVIPDLGDEERLTWLPVDIAAEAFVEGSLEDERVMAHVPTEHVKHTMGQKANTEADITGANSENNIEINKAAVRVLHLVNPDVRLSFTDFVIRLQNLQSHKHGSSTKQTTTSSSTKATAREDINITIVPADQWLAKLEALQTSTNSSDAQSLLRLLPFWKQAYANRQPSSSDKDAKSSLPDLTFDLHNSLISMPCLTHWLGKSTLEAAKQMPKKGKKQGSRSSLVTEGIHSTILNGEVRDPDVEVGGVDDGVGVDGAITDAIEGDEDDDEHIAELLKKAYVLNVWEWVMENVP